MRLRKENTFAFSPERSPMASRTFCGMTTWNFGEMVTVSIPSYDTTIDSSINQKLEQPLPESFVPLRLGHLGQQLFPFRERSVSVNLPEMSRVKIDPELHKAKKPDWIKVRLPSNPVFFSTKALVSDLRLHTVCESAQCPNRWECWSQGTATFMIAGDRCTRACGFCAVTTAKPFALEHDEPQRVAEAVMRMKLKHVVITAVARDDVPDGGALHFARTIEAIRERDASIIIEVLVPDFNGKDDSLRTVLEAAPHIFNHNLETVERLTPVVRSRAKYKLSLEFLARAKELHPDITTKSGLMLGLGETETEIFQAMDDLREHGVEVLTMGQYLRPTPQHLPVVEYIRPEVFNLYGDIARNKGFTHVASGPLVRSSYHAADFNPLEAKEKSSACSGGL
jgi:lipoic acid synthetase